MTTAAPPVSEQIVRAVADTVDTDTLELPPLYEAIDPDALDRLIEGMTSGEISFIYAGYEVTVRSDSTVELTPAPSDIDIDEITVSSN